MQKNDNDSHYHLTLQRPRLEYAMIIVFGSAETIQTMFKLHSEDKNGAFNQETQVKLRKQKAGDKESYYLW